MKYTYYATVVALFELEGKNNEAQAWVLSKVEPIGRVESIDVTKWVDVYRNEAVVVQRDGGEFGKFSTTIDLIFESDNGYSDAQMQIVNALSSEEERTHMNIQSVRLTRSTNSILRGDRG